MGYRIRRVDKNQSRVVAKFRALGCKVLILSEMGRGVPDILVGIDTDKFCWMALVEIKNGDLSLSRRKLTPDEQKFHDEWQAFVYIVSNEQEACNLVDVVTKGLLNAKV